jgi:regulator of sigma E protease
MLLEVGRQDDNPCRNQVLGAQPGVEISCRNGNLVLKVVPRENPPAGEGPLGVVISDVEQKFYPWYQMIPLGIWQGLKEALGWLTLISQSLAGMIYQLIFQGVVPRDVAGPIGIFQITGTAVKFGFLSVLQFLGVLSINLAVINILPLPALDGGRFVFIAYEAVTKRKPNARLEARIHAAGMVFLLGLILLITINDLLRIIKLVIGN